jgi:hypothetical protein
MYLFCNSRTHVITLYSGHVCVYYASTLQCWHLVWILVRTDHPCLGVGCHIVHPVGKNPINTTHTLHTPVHVRLAYAFCRWSPYVATFHEPSIELSRATTLEKRGSWHNPQHVGWPIRGSVYSFFPKPTNEALGAKPSIYQRQATRLTEPISPACDRYWKCI